MDRKSIKCIITISLLVIFINRAVFVAMPGVETSCLSYDVNTLFETILNWVGIENFIDEDGDSPENYNTVNSAQPLLDDNFSYIHIHCPFATLSKIFHVSNDTMLSLLDYGTIDHPPEISV